MKVNEAIQRHKDMEDQKIFGFGPDLTFAVAVHPRIQLITRLGLEKRDYSVSNYRDGTYWNASQYVRFFFGEDNHELMLGITGYGNDPEVKEYKSLEVEDRRDTQWRAGATVALDLTDVITLDLSYQYVHNDSNSELYQYTQNLVRSGITYNF